MNAQEQLDQIVTAASDLLAYVKSNVDKITMNEGHLLLSKLRETTGYMYSIQHYIQSGNFNGEDIF